LLSDMACDLLFFWRYVGGILS